MSGVFMGGGEVGGWEATGLSGQVVHSQGSGRWEAVQVGGQVARATEDWV